MLREGDAGAAVASRVRRGRGRAQGGGLQEDQVLHAGEPGLRRHPPARGHDPHAGDVVHGAARGRDRTLGAAGRPTSSTRSPASRTCPTRSPRCCSCATAATWASRSATRARSGSSAACGLGRRGGRRLPDDAPPPIDAFDPTIFLYDHYSGGIGLAEALHPALPRPPPGRAGPHRRMPLPRGLPLLRRPRPGGRAAARRRRPLRLLDLLIPRLVPEGAPLTPFEEPDPVPRRPPDAYEA